MKIKVFFFVFAATFLMGCSNNSSDPSCNTGEAEVEMTFLNLKQTRGPVAAENTVYTVDLLVFEHLGGAADNAVFLYSRYAWLKSGSTYRAVLKEGSGLNIYFAINARSLIDKMNADMASGVTYTYADVKEMLVVSNPNEVGLTDGLPMWGIASDRTITGSASNILGTIKLLRAVASTDVTVTAANFTLAQGHIVYGADKGYLPYSSTNTTVPDTDGDFQVVSPEVPAGMLTNKDWSFAPASGVQAINNVFYMYENDAVGTGGKKQTKLILEGKWSGSKKIMDTFYPLAFRDPDTNDKLKVRRNTKYIFYITNVNGDGYETLEEAKDAEDVNMDYEVIEWNQYNDGDIYVEGSRYFSIPSKKVVLANHEGATTELVFTTNYALDNILMKYSESDTGVANVIDTHNRFKVEVLTKYHNGIPYTCFAVTAKQVYGASDNPATLIVTAGLIKFTIEIEQVQEKWESGGDIGVEVTYP